MARNLLVADDVPEMADFWGAVFSAFSPLGYRVLTLHCASEQEEEEVIAHVKNLTFTTAYIGNGPELGVRIKRASPKTDVVLTCGPLTAEQKRVLGRLGFSFENLLDPSTWEKDGRAEEGVAHLTEPAERHSGLSVLVVDDEPSIVDYIQALLSHCGYRAFGLCCTTPRDVFNIADHARWIRFDVALVGAVMPPGPNSGPFVAGCIKRVSPGTRTVFITEEMELEKANSLRDQGIEFDSIVAPFDPDELLNKLAEYERAGPLVPGDEPPVRGTTAEILLSSAEALEWEARRLEPLADLIENRFKGPTMEIGDEDIPF